MEVKYTLFAESKSSKLDKLLEVYDKDPKKARVLFLNTGEFNNFCSNRLVMFERGDDFEITTFKRTYGISITNRLYNSEKKLRSIIYKSGKFWFINHANPKIFVNLTYNCLKIFFQDWRVELRGENKVHDYLLKKFSWIRFISENIVLKSISFNTFTKYKLYNLNDALRHIFGVPLPVIKTYLQHSKNNIDYDGNTIKNFKRLKKRLINIENLRIEMLSHPFFNDMIRLSDMLNKKINCSWSINRLISEHDKWSIEVSDILAELTELTYLNIKKVYLDFASHANLVPLRTNQDLIREGSIQHHCVGSYQSRVDSGQCCIYHVNGYTLELIFEGDFIIDKFKDKKLKIKQFRGYRNKDAPDSLVAEIQAHLDEFNNNLKDYEDYGISNYVNNCGLINA